MKVKDEALSDQNKTKDGYPDILVLPVDSCKKYRWIFFNIASEAHRTYEEIFDNIAAKLATYLAAGQKEGDAMLTSGLPT